MAKRVIEKKSILGRGVKVWEDAYKGAQGKKKRVVKCKVTKKKSCKRK